MNNLCMIQGDNGNWYNRKTGQFVETPSLATVFTSIEAETLVEGHSGYYKFELIPYHKMIVPHWFDKMLKLECVDTFGGRINKLEAVNLLTDESLAHYKKLAEDNNLNSRKLNWLKANQVQLVEAVLHGYQIATSVCYVVPLLGLSGKNGAGWYLQRDFGEWIPSAAKNKQDAAAKCLVLSKNDLDQAPKWVQQLPRYTVDCDGTILSGPLHNYYGEEPKQ